MPQRQRHRGKHPKDNDLFADKWLPVLRNAVRDLSYLLTQGYAQDPALKLVGGHHQLAVRQRRAVLRASCPDESLRRRVDCAVGFDALRAQDLIVDGYNLLITVESVLGHGLLIRGRDGCIRDLASIHGSYHKVEETLPALGLIGETLHESSAAHVRWVLDAPVSNSGRVKAMIMEEANRHGWPWDVDLADNVDERISVADAVAVTSDGWILDRAARWTDMVAPIVRKTGRETDVIDLGPVR